MKVIVELSFNIRVRLSMKTGAIVLTSLLE